MTPATDTKPTAPAGAGALLDALLAVARHFERPLTADALLAGLPAEPGPLSLDIFRRACERLGLTVEFATRPLASLGPADLPAVALLQDERAALLVAGPAGEDTRILAGDGREHAASPAGLEPLHTGHVLLIRRENGAPAVAPRRPGGASWFWSTLRPYIPLYRDIALLAVAVNLLGLAMPLAQRVVYDRVIPNQALSTLWVLVAGLGLALAFDLCLRIMRTTIVDAAGVRADEKLSGAIFAQALALPLQASGKSVGGLAEEIREFSSIRDFFTSTTLTTLVDLLFAFIYLIGIWLVAGVLVLVPLIAVPLAIGASYLFQIPLARSVESSQREAGRQHSLLIETLGSLETLKCLSAEGWRQRTWERAVAVSAQSAQNARRWTALSMGVAGTLQQAVSLATLLFGVLLVTNNQLTMGGLIAATILCGRAIAPIGGVSQLLTRFHRARLAFRSLDGFMRMETEAVTGPASISLPRARGEIAFERVCFAYGPNQAPVLTDISFRIRPGERVAIIGRSGSGKTTLGRLLAGLHRPTAGSIHLDGVDIRHLPPSDLRRGIGLVPQEPVLFMGTVRDNLLLGNPQADDEAMLRAARLAGVDEFIRPKPEGYGFEVGERGRNLSGGQRQAVALARAVLREPPVLVLDEPTSSLDTTSELQLVQRLGALLGPEHTLLLTTHRAAPLQLVNRVLVVDQGRLVADGPRDEVLKKLREGPPAAAPAVRAPSPGSVLP